MYADEQFLNICYNNLGSVIKTYFLRECPKKDFFQEFKCNVRAIFIGGIGGGSMSSFNNQTHILVI